jgi:uncharacterized membrane protein YobD (UPF0266 family)
MGAKKIINWEAQEYIARKKNPLWFVIMGLVVAALLALAIFAKDWSFCVLIVVGVIALMLYILRPPRKLHYVLDDKGLTEGNKFYSYNEFKSFGILSENNHYSIVLTPRKRFNPRNNVFFPETQGEEIVDMFGEHLPMEPVELDLLDKLIRLLRI